MRCVVQRVKHASVSVEGEGTGSIDGGLLVYVGIADEDTADTVAWMARKLVKLRIFDDDTGRFDRSMSDVGGALLSVSQFTLYGDASRGTRPSFSGAGRPEHAERLWTTFNDEVRALGIRVATGVFGAHMVVDALNDGPVTLIIER